MKNEGILLWSLILFDEGSKSLPNGKSCMKISVCSLLPDHIYDFSAISQIHFLFYKLKKMFIEWLALSKPCARRQNGWKGEHVDCYLLEILCALFLFDLFASTEFNIYVIQTINLTWFREKVQTLKFNIQIQIPCLWFVNHAISSNIPELYLSYLQNEDHYFHCWIVVGIKW